MVNQYYIDFLNELDYIYDSNWMFVTNGKNIEAFNMQQSVFSNHDETAVFCEEKDWLSVQFSIPLQAVKSNLMYKPCDL